MSNSDNPLVSVVIASYNHRKYIEDAIASLARQDYDNIEIIVIDDGSTDGSGELLDVLIGKYDFRLIKRDNGGLVSVLNLAIEEVRGEYVVFHASDDASPSSRIGEQLAILRRYPAAAFVSGNVEFITERGKSTGTMRPVTGLETELGFDDLFLHRASVSSVASMYRAKALRHMGRLDERYRAEDPQIFWRLTSLGYSWIQSSGDPVISYRMLFTSQSRTMMPLLESQLVNLVDEFSDHPLYSIAAAKARTGLFSALAESDKVAAIRLALTRRLAWRSGIAIRGILKILVPQRLHYIFKRAGR